MKKIYILPNIVTTANMYCGFYSVILSIQQDFVKAAWFILAAGIFDMLDGRIARMARATSSFGVEYDSLSDLISFGLAPAILLHQFALHPFGRLGILIPFLLLACAALRLARFNVSVSRLPKAYFQGLPSPAAAGTIATFVIFHDATGWFDLTLTRLIAVTLGVAIGALMVSSVPFASFKELNWRSRASFGFLMVAVISIVLISIQPEFTLFMLLFAYIAISLLWYGYLVVRGKAPSLLSAPPSASAENLKK